MTKDQKVVAIQDIKALLQDAKVVYIADLEGLNAAKSSDFRRQAFKNNIKVKVVKNTLLQKAMEQLEDVDFSEIYGSFKGNSALMISDTANAPAKLIRDFRKKEEKPAVKSAFVQETFYIGDNHLETLANIKSREEMIGEIIGLLQSPIRRLISALQNKSEEVSKIEAKEEIPAQEIVETAPAEEPKAEEAVASSEEVPTAEVAETPEAENNAEVSETPETE